MRWIAGFLLMAGMGAAAQQQGVPRPEPMGTVAGHIFCADTQRPARMARVSLIPVPKRAVETTKASAPDDSGGLKAQGDAVETGLDGSFNLQRVRAGEYFLVVDMDGYRLPLAEFSFKELLQPSDEVMQRMSKMLQMIVVTGEQTTAEEIRLERGASVSGTVTYDDGSPANGLGVKVLMKNSAGKWEEGIGSRYRAGFGHVQTDDYGRYRVTGLPPGEYLMEVDMALNDFETTTMPMPGSPEKSMTLRTMKTRFELALFTGNVWRKMVAVALTLGQGEERTGADLQFPISKLHRLSGQVVAKDGHALNDGRVELVWADDASKMTEAKVQFEEAAFHLEFVPEGEFTLKAVAPRDVVRVQVENGPGVTPRFHEETKTVRTYGDAEQGVVVKGDMQGVTMTVPEAKGASK